jgi:hypothetical protein
VDSWKSNERVVDGSSGKYFSVVEFMKSCGDSWKIEAELIVCLRKFLESYSEVYLLQLKQNVFEE